MSISAYLFDANGTDRPIELSGSVGGGIDESQILWVDAVDPTDDELERVGQYLKLDRDIMMRVTQRVDVPRVDTTKDSMQVVIIAPIVEGTRVIGVPMQLVAGPNYVVATHKVPFKFLDSFEEQTRGDTQLGELDSGTFLVALLNHFINSYFEVLDTLGTKVDRLDESALRNVRGKQLLTEIVALRRQVSALRALLAPHRQVFGMLAGPDFAKVVFADKTPDFSGLLDRVEKALDGVESARDMVIGSFEVFTSVLAQNTNDTVRVLTVVTVVIGISGVLAGVMGMNFTDWEFFHSGFAGFSIVVGVMIVVALGVLLLAKWRRLY